METTLLVAELDVPEGSFTVQENTYGVGGEYNALLTATVIVTPEEVDSNIRPGEDVML
jgi:hypothetical protein